MTPISPGSGFVALWGLWALAWIGAAFWSRRTAQAMPWRQAWSYRLLVLAGALLMSRLVARALDAPRLWHVGWNGAWALVALAALSLGFTGWARLALGDLWSGSITLKEGHRVVQTGPYAIVRHPIYTGILAAALATAAAKATLPALLGCALVVGGLRLKAGLEEALLRRELGTPYEAYRRRVPMLIPFFPAR
jgi:protein-S-isoprenylcysteine O-methyltransferase Ste14